EQRAMAEAVQRHEITEPQPSPMAGKAAASTPLEVAADNSECMVPKPLPEPEAYSLGDVETPAEAKSHVQEPSEAEGSGGVQDRCGSTPPPHSPETAERGAGPETAPASDGDAMPLVASPSTPFQSSAPHEGSSMAVSAPALDESGDSA